MEKIETFSSSRHIANHHGGLNDVQRNLLSFMLGIFHSKSSLTLQVCLRQEDSAVSVPQTEVVNVHCPLVARTVIAPNFLQIIIRIRDWLVYMSNSAMSKSIYFHIPKANLLQLTSN